MLNGKNLLLTVLLVTLTSYMAFGQDLVPFRSKSGSYSYVEKGTNLPILNGQWDRAYLFYNGLARVTKGDKYGFIDVKGELVIPLSYDYAQNFEQGIAVIGISGDGEFPMKGMIDTLGNLITPVLYDHFGEISEGLRSVHLDEHVGFVDLQGRLRIPVKFRGTYEVPPYFNEGVCAVENPNEEYASTFGFIDTSGKFVLKPKFKLWGGAAMNNLPILSEGLFVFTKKGKFGYRNRKGKVVLKAVYDGAEVFSEGLAAVRIKDEVIFIDHKGKRAFDLVLGGIDEGVMGFWYDGFENGKAIVNLNHSKTADGYGSYYTEWESGLIDTNGTILAIKNSIPSLDNDYFTYIEDVGDSTSHIHCKSNGTTLKTGSKNYIRKSFLGNYMIIGDAWILDESYYYYIDDNGFEYREE